MTSPNAIPAGPELDKAVHREIMGTDFVPFTFQPSTNIAHAWLVVEKMREKGCGATVTVNPRGTYCAWFNTTYNQRHVAAGDTAPEAICRAALAAVRAQAKERT
jgi:hypothetical protein